MKILVPTKRVPDTDQKIHIRADALGVIGDDLPFVINPFDAIALEEAPSVTVLPVPFRVSLVPLTLRLPPEAVTVPPSTASVLPVPLTVIP